MDKVSVCAPHRPGKTDMGRALVTIVFSVWVPPPCLLTAACKALRRHHDAS